jgi:hypothetical protein
MFIKQGECTRPAYSTGATTKIAEQTTRQTPISLLTPRLVAPGQNCGPLDKCTGGSLCVDAFCLCPAGLAPSAQGVCELRPLQIIGSKESPPKTGSIASALNRPRKCIKFGEGKRYLKHILNSVTDTLLHSQTIDPSSCF